MSAISAFRPSSRTSLNAAQAAPRSALPLCLTASSSAFAFEAVAVAASAALHRGCSRPSGDGSSPFEQDAASAWLEPLSRSRAGASFVVASRGHGEMVREAMVMAMGRTVAPKVRTDVA